MKTRLVTALSVVAGVFVFAGCAKNNEDSYVRQQSRAAESGDHWAQYNLWAAYHYGTNGVDADQVKANEWLKQFVEGVYVVRFGPVGNFNPKTAGDYLNNVRMHTPEVGSTKTGVGTGSFLRTTREGDSLVASFLTDQPDKLRAAIDRNPDLGFIAMEVMTAESFILYEKAAQESLSADP